MRRFVARAAAEDDTRVAQIRCVCITTTRARLLHTECRSTLTHAFEAPGTIASAEQQPPTHSPYSSRHGVTLLRGARPPTQAPTAARVIAYSCPWHGL